MESYLLKAYKRGSLSSDGIGREMWIVGLDLHSEGELLCHVQRTTKILKVPDFHAATLNICVLEKSLNQVTTFWTRLKCLRLQAEFWNPSEVHKVIFD